MPRSSSGFDRSRRPGTRRRLLTANAVLAGNDASMAKARSGEAKKRATDARKEAQDARVEAARLDAAREANEKRLDDVAVLRNRLLTSGLLVTDERTDEVRDREAALA